VPLLKRFSDALRQVFRANPPATVSAADRAAALERKIARLVDELPAMPVTATRALALIEDPDVALSDLADLIREDTALATAILRVANSALYAGGSQTLRLDQAVVRLGLWSCKSLITAVGVRSVVRGQASPVEAECRALWHHGFVTASLCAQLNRGYRLGFGGEEYAAGLLHDLGRMLIALADSECLRLAEVMDFREEGDPLARERAAIGVDHCSLGAWFGELSCLPDSLVAVIRHHHAPDGAGTMSRLAALVAAADHIANHAQCGSDSVSYDPATNTGLAALTAKWSPRRRDQLRESIPALVEEAVASAERERA
jgi:HD-like signal output (HDOD) protein